MAPRLPIPGVPPGGQGRKRPSVLDASRAALIPLRPLTISEILDASFLIVRRNVRLMLGLPLVVTGGSAVYLLFGLLMYWILGNTTGQVLQVVFVVLMAMLGGMLLVQGLVWMTGILSRVSLQTVLGEGFAPSTTKVTLRTSLHLFWPMFGLAVLQYFATSLVQGVLAVLVNFVTALVLTGNMVLMIISYVVWLFIALAVSSAAYGLIGLTVPSFSLESRRAPGWIGKPEKPTTVFSSFERSFQLVGTKNLVRVALVFSAAMVITVAVITAMTLGILLVIALYVQSLGLSVGAVLDNPWVILAVAAFSTLVALSGAVAYLAAVQTILYLDLRMRREALDLPMRFDAAPIPQPAPVPLQMMFPPPGALPPPPGPPPPRPGPG